MLIEDKLYYMYLMEPGDYDKYIGICDRLIQNGWECCGKVRSLKAYLQENLFLTEAQKDLLSNMVFDYEFHISR